METSQISRFLKRSLRVGWKLALVVVVAGFIVYRVRYAPVPVESQAVTRGAIVSEVMGTGTLEARVSATISPKISGLVTQVLADQGDRVTKGELLVTLDDGDLRQQVQIAQAELEAVQAGVQRTTAEIARAEAGANLARIEHERVVELRSSGAVTPFELDKAVQQLAAAEAEQHRAQLAKVEMERQGLRAEASLRYYEERLADTKITSPFDGLVVRRSREPGDVVVPGSDLLQIISTDQLWVSAWVDETAMTSLAAGQPARVVFRSESDKFYSGTVTRMSPLADRETREFLVDVTVNDLPTTWAVGQRAEVYIETARKDQVLLVPQRSIVWRQGRAGLFVSSAGHATWRSVTLGLRGAETVEIGKGLNAGEIVIWPGDPKGAALTEGRAVSVS